MWKKKKASFRERGFSFKLRDLLSFNLLFSLYVCVIGFGTDAQKKKIIMQYCSSVVHLDPYKSFHSPKRSRNNICLLLIVKNVPLWEFCRTVSRPFQDSTVCITAHPLLRVAVMTRTRMCSRQSKPAH